MTNYFYRYWFGEFPWDDMQAYWKRSPLAYVGNVKTPTMLMTGEWTIARRQARLNNSIKR